MTLFLILAGTLTSGFFLYVLVKFHGEMKKLDAAKKRRIEKTRETEAGLESDGSEMNSASGHTWIHFESLHRTGAMRTFRIGSKQATVVDSRSDALARREAWVSVMLGVCGLAALFAGIEIFNLLMMASH